MIRKNLFLAGASVLTLLLSGYAMANNSIVYDAEFQKVTSSVWRCMGRRRQAAEQTPG